MPTEKNRSLQKAVFLLCLIFLFQGCAMLAESRKRREELVEKIEKQKKAYLDLKKDLQDKVLKVGSSQTEVELKYGRPGDIFDSTSEVSDFALWSYEFPDASRDEAYRPIRLYFNNGKLTHWSN